jgi:acetyltransferase
MPDLSALFNPGSIAVVGASKGTGPGENVIRNILALGFPGSVYPINPKYDELQGLPCYPSLEAVPERVDAVVVALASRHVPGVLEQAARVGARAAVVFSAGFAEMGEDGSGLQREVARIARESDLAVVGPNCLGVIQPHSRLGLVSASLPGGLRAGEVAVVSQSGSIAIAIMNNSRGIGFSHIVSSGNEAALNIAHYVEYFAEDERTRIIVAFVEGIRDGTAFRRAADRAVAAGKPLIVLKVGRSELGRRTTLAHTGSLAGSDAVHDAVFRRHGIIRVDDLDELFETLELFTYARPAAGDRVGIISLSGGQLALIADLAASIGVRLPELEPRTRDELERVLPPFRSRM